MEKLIKPFEYAQKLGISRQAVYAKIKNGTLHSRDVSGKLFIVIDESVKQKTTVQTEASAIYKETTSNHLAPKTQKNSHQVDFHTLLKAKDETIEVLKGTVKGLKKSNKQMSITLRGEIDLLKQAFNEMRTLYVSQIEQIRPQVPYSVDIVSNDKENEVWVGAKKFFKYHAINVAKEQKNILKKIEKAYLDGDTRVLKKEGKLKFNIDKSFEDIVK